MVGQIKKSKTLTISSAKSVFASFASAVAGAANTTLLFNQKVKSLVIYQSYDFKWFYQSISIAAIIPDSIHNIS